MILRTGHRDLFDLAGRLAVHSNGLRATLAMIERRRHLMTMGEIEQILYRGCEAAMMWLGVNEEGELMNVRPLTEVRDSSRYAEVLKVMRFPDYLGTPAHMAQKWLAVRQGTDPRLLEWSDTVISRLARLGCPLYVRLAYLSEAHHKQLFVTGGVDWPWNGDSPYNHGRAVELVHGVLGRDLPADCWTIISDVGFDVAESLRLDLLWGPHDAADLVPDRFWHWEVNDWRELPPVPLERVEFPDRHNWSKSPSGEVEMLLKLYGIT